ncbi:hypothetical protein [Microvirga zambiensis]|uniref:hypothetical protein n=1 Tax=Microvirga zambiensis TaxID=1402137 RepID=UPI00191EA6B2|nr:hypothetical protein [Microvirga zambiensis]
MARSTSPTTARMIHNTAARAHPDLVLLRLMDQHTKARARVDAIELAVMVKRQRLPEAEFDRLCAKVSGIEDAILAQPSHTPEGLGIKARIAARYMQTPEDWGVRTYEVLSRFLQEVVCLTDPTTSGRV